MLFGSAVAVAESSGRGRRATAASTCTAGLAIDRNTLTGTLNYVGPDDLGSRTPHPDLRPDPRLPDHTRLWAALQEASGGTWGGAVYDVDAIVTTLKTGSPVHVIRRRG